MSRLTKQKKLNMNVQKRGSIFAKYTVCESLKELISKARKNNPSVKEHEIKLKKHNIHKNFVGIYITLEKMNLCNLKKISYVQFMIRCTILK
jgi:hypothetical protein